MPFPCAPRSSRLVCAFERMGYTVPMCYFFAEFGPNSNTFVYPAEVFPVQTRASPVGLGVTLWMLPETKGKSLEELSDLAASHGAA